MRVKQLVKKSIGAGFIFFILLSLSFPLTNAKISINEDDGIWSDDFTYDTMEEANENLTIDNCKIYNQSGVVTLNPETHPRSYHFAEEDFPHKASLYRSIIFSPLFFLNFPGRHPSSEFNDRDYDGIKVKNDDAFATRSSKGLFRYVVQEFRFQFDVGADSVGSIGIYWKGKAENAQKVVLYYWKYIGENKLVASWEKLNDSSADIIEFNNTIDVEKAKLAITEDNYFYICVVATSSQILQACTLSSDYIEISSLTEDAWDEGPGTITTNTSIIPPSNFYWEMLTWNDYQPDKTSIRCQILYEKDGNFTPIPDELEYFSGSNENGFSSSPVYLNKIPTSGPGAITEIRIRANLTSQTASRTPKLSNWAVTWQKDTIQWRDSFNSSYRIGSKSKINVVDGSVNISSLQGEWPMFGYNLKNTRATDGKGPQSSNPPLKWYSRSNQLVGMEHRNPVIGDEYVYIFNETNALCRYDIDGGKPNTPDVFPTGDGDVYLNSPIITEDYIIIASSKSGKEGGKNNIRILNKYTLNEDAAPYEYEEKTCYYASPVVYDNKIFISSWSGYTKWTSDDVYNKVLAVDLLNNPPELLWEYDLPSGSYSTPAVHNDWLFVGCSESTEDSFFVLETRGNGDGTTNLVWSEAVGAIGRSSPVIYNDTVFVTSKSLGKIQVTALRIDKDSNDRVLWEKSICVLPDGADADSTPAVYDGVLYVASPRGTIYALNVTNGETLWSKSIYITLLRNYLTSSPVYADGYLYVGTPAGSIKALDTQDNGSIVWEKTTFESESFVNAPIISSPIVSNEMLFIADEAGVLYGFGTYEELNEEMKGSITSIPINLPTGYWWGKFYVNYTSETGSSVRFSLLDNNKNHMKNISNEDPINLGYRPNLRSIYLHADLTAANLSVNPILRWWKITFEIDNTPPDFVEESFQPTGGWINTSTPECTIDVWDNETGLSLSESTFTITYDTQNESDLKKTFTPVYTGVNGTNFSTLKADISSLDISQNITNLTRIVFKIQDFGANEETFSIYFKQDTTKPTSRISNETNGSKFNSEFVVINATAEDQGDDASEIESVQLIYRYSSSRIPNFSGSWKKFEAPLASDPFTWNFTTIKHGGHYELATIATDVTGNVEEEPESGDVSFIFDNEISSEDAIDFLNTPNWFTIKPNFRVKFKDDFLLKSVEYQPNFDTTTWEQINVGDIDQQETILEWEITQKYWEQMQEREIYYLSFRLTDSLENVYITPDTERLQIQIDAAKPNVDLEIPTIETEWSFEDTFTIKAFATDGNGSGIKSVELFYQYSEDGKFDGNWTSYGVLTFEPFEWEFEAEEGNGYYEFKIVAKDLAGNVAESEVFSTGINIFPLFSVVAMVLLIIALIIITIVIFTKWRKK